MLKILNQILELICNFFKLKINQEQSKIKEKEKQNKNKKSLEEQKQDIKNTVYNGDADTINKIINSCIIISLMIGLSGCIQERIVYVSSDREVKKITYENSEGYFVPNSVMSELLQYKVEAKYYKEAYESLKYKENN